MIDTETLVLSARGCGLEAHLFNGQVRLAYAQDNLNVSYWNPPENAEQNWMCVEELLRRGWSFPIFKYLEKNGVTIEFSCQPNEFACRALAEVVRRESE